MCVFTPGVPPPVYVSVWLALDDCDAINGCLEVCAYWRCILNRLGDLPAAQSGL